MELILLLIFPLALGGLLLSNGDDSDDDQVKDETDTAPEANKIDGTAENDVLHGTGGDDIIEGGGGNNLIFGLGGNDTLLGGDGVDIFAGGNGNDVLTGGGEDDWLAGGNGNDTVDGGAGSDVLAGGAGDDRLSGGDGNDLLIGSTGADQLYGNTGDDILDGVSPVAGHSLADTFSGTLREEIATGIGAFFGDAAADADIHRFMRDLSSDQGEDAPDALYGGAGRDWLLGNDGDTLSGGGGQDSFFVHWTAGNDAVSITDYNAASEAISLIVDGDAATVPEFGVREAASGTGVEVVLGGDVVAFLADVSLAAISTDEITMQLQNGDGRVYPAIRLPTLAA